MVKSLHELSLADILPGNLLQDPQLYAAAMALDGEFQAVTADIEQCLLLPRLDVLPEDVLDLLAWQWHVDFYEPIGMSIETKRNMIRRSVAWHRIKGTPAAVEMVLDAVFDESRVVEWFEYGGRAYHFNVQTTWPEITRTEIARLRRAIFCAKNVRSWLDVMEFIAHIEDDISIAIDDAAGTDLAATIGIPIRDWYPYGMRNPDLPVIGQNGAYVEGLRYNGIPVIGSAMMGGSTRNPLYYGGSRDFDIDEAEVSVLYGLDDYLTGNILTYGRNAILGAACYGGNPYPTDLGSRFSLSMYIRDEEKAADDAPQLAMSLRMDGDEAAPSEDGTQMDLSLRLEDSLSPDTPAVGDVPMGGDVRYGENTAPEDSTMEIAVCYEPRYGNSYVGRMAIGANRIRNLRQYRLHYGSEKEAIGGGICYGAA